MRSRYHRRRPPALVVRVADHYSLLMSESDSVSAPSPALAAATLDLSDGAETTGGMIGRIALGIGLMVLGGALTLGILAAYLAGAFMDGWVDWIDVLGDIVLALAAVTFGIAIGGFELVRRGRRRRASNVREAAEAAQAAAALGAGAEPADTSAFVAPTPPTPLV
jgi:hypothetical protein